MWLWVVPVNEKIKQPNFSNVDLDPVEAAVLIPALVKYHFCANLLALVLSIKGTVLPKLKIQSVSIHPRAEFGRSFVVHKTFLELHSVVGLHLHCNIVIKMQLFCPSHHMIIPVISPPTGGGSINRWRHTSLQLLQQRECCLCQAPAAARRLPPHLLPAGITHPRGR